MAYDPDAKLSDVLAGGYDINNRLQALLSRPLDSRGQEAAMAFSQELSRVFLVSLSMLNGNSVAPEVRTGNRSGVSTPAKDKRARSDNGEVVTPTKKSREEGLIIRKEITPSPHTDGYQWRKYGQKKIQNCNFSRYYFKCNCHRRCKAKKKVQQQDGGPPMFEVTYVNEHTCDELRASDDAAARMASLWTTSRQHAGAADTARGGGGGGLFGLLPYIVGSGGGGGSAEENEAMVSCLATVISGSVPPSSSGWPPAPEASASDPAAFVLPGPAARSASVDGSVAADDGAAATTMMMMAHDTGFSWDPWWSMCPGEEAARHQLVIMNPNHHRDDMHMDGAGGFADTVWPEHTCGAWRRA